METFVYAMKLFITTTLVLVGSTVYFTSIQTEGRMRDGEIVVRRRLRWRGRKLMLVDAKNAKAINPFYVGMVLAWLGSVGVYVAVLWTTLTGLLMLVTEYALPLAILLAALVTLWAQRRGHLTFRAFKPGHIRQIRSYNDELLAVSEADRRRLEQTAAEQAAVEAVSDEALRE